MEFEQTVIFCDSQLITLVVYHGLLMHSSLLSPSPHFSWLIKSSLLVSFALVDAKHCLEIRLKLPSDGTGCEDHTHIGDVFKLSTSVKCTFLCKN